MKKVILMLSIIATGCAGIQPTAKELAEADYGEEIKCPGDLACSFAKAFVTAGLADPEGARVSLSTSKGYIVSEGRVLYGYKMFSMLNAKNLYGAYTGNNFYAAGFARKEKGHTLVCDNLHHCTRY